MIVEWPGDGGAIPVVSYARPLCSVERLVFGMTRKKAGLCATVPGYDNTAFPATLGIEAPRSVYAMLCGITPPAGKTHLSLFPADEAGEQFDPERITL